MTSTPSDEEVDRLLSARLRSAAEAFDSPAGSAELNVVEILSRDRRSKIRRRLGLIAGATSAIAIGVVVAMPLWDQAGRSEVVQKSQADDSLDLEIAATEQRLALLVEREAAITAAIERLEAQVEKQRVASQRVERELQRSHALATIRAIEQSSEGLFSDELRARLRNLTVDESVEDRTTNLSL